MSEIVCEPLNDCNVDQHSFKAYLSRWMAATMVIAPFTRTALLPLLQSSTRAAVKTCTGGTDPANPQCGFKWTTSSFDGSVGIGEQMSALSVVQSNLFDTVPGPVTQRTGGLSKGNPSAGTGSTPSPTDLYAFTVTTGQKVGAGFLTTFVLLLVLGAAWWMVA